MYCRICYYFIPDGSIRCAHCGTYQRKWRSWATWNNFGILVTLTMAIFIGLQSYNINTQTENMVKQTDILTKSFELEKRPYLYLDIKPIAFSHREKQKNGQETYNLYLGGKLIYKNIGKLPAYNINSTIFFYNDMDVGDNFKRLKDWYIEKHGNFPEPSLVFPNEEGQDIIFNPDCSDAAKNFFFTIRVEYTGENPEKIYWYATDVWYVVNKNYFKYRLPGIDEYIDYNVSLIGAPRYCGHYDKSKGANYPPILSRQEFINKIPKDNKKP